MARRVTSPFNVNALALACLPTALGDSDHVREYVRQVRQGREESRRELVRWGIPCGESQANFVLAKIGPAHAAFVEGIEKRGVLVRDRSGDAGCEGCVRITIGDTTHTAQLLNALRETLATIGAKEVTLK
jgi:histidinol-phosphate aminotransferase